MRSTDETLRFAERAWRLKPKDPGAGERFTVACARAGVAPPLELLEQRTLPPREVDLPREGLVAVWVAGRPLFVEFPTRWGLGGSVRFHISGHPVTRILRRAGAQPLGTRGKVEVAVGPLPAARLRATLQELIAALPGERLHLHVATDALRTGDRLEPVVAPQGLMDLELSAWRVIAGAGWAHDEGGVPAAVLSALSGLRIGKLVLHAPCPSDTPLPAASWALHSETSVQTPESWDALGSILARSLGVRVLEVPAAAVVFGLLGDGEKRRLGALERLVVDGGPLDEMLGNLLACRTPALRHLELRDCILERGVLPFFGELPLLNELHVRNLHVSSPAAALQDVRRMPGLRWVSFSPASDEALQGWQGLRLLERLTLYLGRLTSSGARVLARLPRLRSLQLVGVELDDDVVKALGGCVGLEDLSIKCHHRGVTDEGLRALHGLRRVRRLFVNCAGVTRAGRLALRAALPRCTVTPADDRCPLA